MATASAFSYAQAAKGQGTLTSSTSLNPTSQAQDSQPAAAVTKATAPVETSTESTDGARNPDTRSISGEKQDLVSNIGSDADAQSESVQETHRDSARDEDAGRLDRPWRRNDKGTRSSSTTTRSVDEHDSRRSRKGKKAKASEKQSNEQVAVDKDQEPEKEAPKVELFEAPIPSVNIWQQRKEAQLAKVKPTPANPAEQTSNGLSKAETSTKATEEVVVVASQRDNTPNGVKPHRRPADASRPERSAPRGSRLADKEPKENKAEAPPSVADAASWPTPETAIKEEKKKPAEKVDRPEKDASEDGQSKPRQKEKWVTYDYVPTVNFETQLPQMRGSKPRGGARSANAPRATGTSQASDKAAPAAQQAKLNEPKDRPREAANGANRTVPVPPMSKRASTDVSTTNTREQRKPAAHANTEKAKDSTPNSNEQGHAARDRPEGRGERTRGGYRGRGGHHAINAQHQHQHTTSGFAATGAMAGRAQGPYSPPPRQGGHGQMFMPPQRGGRGGRNNAGANFHRLSLPNGSSRMPPVQAQFGPYDYPITPMPAMPFQPQPYWDNMVLPVLKNQIEYYFSIENLCKDMYLRARMDSQGFVPLHFIAAFKRVRELSADTGLVRAVCEVSPEIDLVVGEDDIERVRRSHGWESFVLPLEERDEFSRNHGPVRLTFKNRPFQMAPQFNGMSTPYGVASPPAYPTHIETPFQQVHDESVTSHGVNGLANGNVNGHAVGSQLSANVPDFSPSGSVPLNDQFKSMQIQTEKAGAVNGHAEDPATASLPNGVHGGEQSVQESAQS